MVQTCNNNQLPRGTDSVDALQGPEPACCVLLDAELETAFFKALADANRVAMLVRLAGCSRACTVSEVACCYPMDVSVVSRHLAALRDAGILTSEKRGREVYYRVNHEVLSTRLRAMADAIDACCPPGGSAASE